MPICDRRDRAHVSIQPIFVLSITRSGSTLVQRVVAAHKGVATVSEPWLLLPLLSTLRERGVEADYTHQLAVRAISDFCDELPRGTDDYLAEMRQFVLRLYEKAAGPDARFFLDKTPPYFLIVSEVMRLFPKGKFVFLWRNPLSVVASIIETYHGGRFDPSNHAVDLFQGPLLLLRAYESHRELVCSARYEDLVAGDVAQWRRVTDYLGLAFQPEALSRFTDVSLHGRMGDPIGPKRYMTLDTAPVEKWRGTIANPIRREWCRRYLLYLGQRRLAAMGYDLDDLLGDLQRQPVGREALLGDAGRLVSAVLREPLRQRCAPRNLNRRSPLRPLL